MSDGEKIEEETYSLIFSALRHPIRRKIMRVLAYEPRTFSEILEAVSIDSGHLNYHLENLGDLITHSPDGKYRLSGIGVAAVKLMSGVEESPPITVSPRGKGRSVLKVFTKISLMILIIALIASSLFFMGFTKSYSNPDTKGGLGFITILPNQTVEFNLTIVYNTGGKWKHSGGPSSFYEERPPMVNTITEWEKGWLRFTFEFNTSYITNVRVYDPSRMMTNEFPIGGEPSLIGFGTGVPITQPGMYITEIENVGSEPISGQIGYELIWQRFERPYFYWGIVGLLIASAYPAFILVKRTWSQFQ